MKTVSLSQTLLAAAALGVTLNTGSARAQSFTVLYDFNGAPGTQASTAATAATVPTGLTAANVSRGSGLNSSTATANAITSTGWTGSATLDPNDYYTFGLTPSAGSKVSLTSLSFLDRRSGTGPQSFDIRASIDNFVSSVSVAAYTFTTAPTSDVARNFDLSGVSSLQNQIAGISLRIYGFAATNTTGTGTYRLSSPTSGTGLALSGTLATVTPPGGGGGAAPEPGTLALLLPVLPILGGVLRRRKG